MAGKRYKVLLVEEGGIDLDDPTEFDLDSTDALLGGAALVLTPTLVTAAAGTLALAATSNQVQIVAGTATGQVIRLPAATTLRPGHRFDILNQASQNVALQDGAGAPLATVAPGTRGTFVCQAGGSAAGTWVVEVTGGVTPLKVTSSTPFSTTSKTDTLITGFAVTPPAGSYLALANFAAALTNTNVSATLSFYVGGAAWASSVRVQKSVVANYSFLAQLMDTVTVNGAEAVDVRVAASAGTMNIGDRTLILVRLNA